MKFKKHAFIAALLTMVLATSACGGGGTTADPTPPAGDTPAATEQPSGADDSATSEPSDDAPAATGRGGDVIYASLSIAPTLDINDPGGNNSATSDITSNVLEGLVWFSTGENPVVEPRLATSWDIVDPVTYVFHLREGVVFHDGTPFTAEAVKMNIERVIDPERASPAAFILETIETVEVIDDYTVQINLVNPFAPILSHLAHPVGRMVSPAALEEAAAGGRTVSENLIGTGPFKLDEWVPGDFIRLVPNPDHWGHVPIVNPVFRAIPDPQTRQAMLQAGEAHLTFLQPSEFLSIEHVEGLDFIEFNTASFSYISMNTSSGPLADVRVRRAIAMSIDRESIFYGVNEGRGMIADGPLPPLVNLAPRGLEMLPFDPEAAKELLIEAGYGDGFTIDFVVNEGNAARAQIAELIQAQLREMNINLEIRVLEWGSFLEDTQNGNFNMAAQGWQVVTGDPDYGMFPLYHSTQHGASGNVSFFANDDVDRLLEEGRFETDPDARQAIYREIGEILMEEVPVVFTTVAESIYGLNGIDGMQFNFTNDPIFYNVTLR